LDSENNIPELVLDSRPYIQEAFEDAIDDVVDYNLNVAELKEAYWPTYKVKLFKSIQKIYYRVDVAFYNERKDKTKVSDIDRLLTEMGEWITRLSKHTGPTLSVSEMDRGKDLLFKLRPYLMLKQLYKVADGVKVEL
jgi:predicted DNA-binding protein